MWLHLVATAGLTVAYGRQLGLSPGGAALAGVSFALCGFQAIHASHEWAYHAVTFLPLVLLLTERHLARGGAAPLAGLALAVGAQWTLGHFQIATWTAILALTMIGWRTAVDRGLWPRAIGAAAALAWGVVIALVQIGLTRELTAFIGYGRPEAQLSYYRFPIEHWFQPALPHLFANLVGPEADDYFARLLTSSGEAWLYVGTVPLILACVGLSAGRDRALAPWRWIALLAFLLATLPGWWPGGYRAVLQVPVLGAFRAPARYTSLASLGLCLLAGRGLDRTISARRTAVGLVIAVVLGMAAGAGGFLWTVRPEVRAALGDARDPALIASALAWAVGLAMV